MVRFGRKIPELLLAAFMFTPQLSAGFLVGNGVSSGKRTFLQRTSGPVTSATSSNEDFSFFEDFSGENNKDNYKKREMLETSSESSNDNRRKKEKPSLFSTGEELKQLRMDLESFRENLKWAEVIDDEELVASLSKEIEEKEKRDPELVYKKAKLLITEAKAASGRDLKPELQEQLIQHWSQQAELARACLPRFQMEGLWVGK